MPKSGSNHTKNELPLPLQAAVAAALPPSYLTPALIRAIEQWCEVLPFQAVTAALSQVSASETALQEFRTAALSIMRGANPPNSGQPLASKIPNNESQATAANEATDVHGVQELSEADRRALTEQARLARMSDADYQGELVRRFRAKTTI